MTFAQTKSSRALWTRRLAYRLVRLAAARRSGNKRRIAHWQSQVAHARAMIRRRDEQIAKRQAARPLRAKALDEAEKLLGVVEQGGNNRGPEVARIIRANGGIVGEPWCGDFVAYCYRRAGSNAVTRAWASVYFLGVVSGLRNTTDPRPGDVVRFNFDHTGLFVRHVRPGVIETIEGNTGKRGAVSDSKTGGDGVYRKERPVYQVANYRRVLR